jgi:hypothetical protein
MTRDYLRMEFFKDIDKVDISHFFNDSIDYIEWLEDNLIESQRIIKDEFGGNTI